MYVRQANRLTDKTDERKDTQDGQTDGKSFKCGKPGKVSDVVNGKRLLSFCFIVPKCFNAKVYF